MTKCLKCGGTQIDKGQIRRSCVEFFSDIVFGPDNVRFHSFRTKGGTELAPDSYACLSYGTVWSQTDAEALKLFI